MKRLVVALYNIKDQRHLKSYVNEFLALFNYVTLGSYLI